MLGEITLRVLHKQAVACINKSNEKSIVYIIAPEEPFDSELSLVLKTYLNILIVSRQFEHL